MRLTLSLLLMLFLTHNVRSSAPTEGYTNNCAPKINLQLDHSNWEKLLQKHVDNMGNVDYKGFIKDIAALQNYLDYLAKNRPFDEAPKPEKLAYYINLYNATTLKLILDNYPTKSIKDIKNPWGKDIVHIGNETISLGDLEHRILRKMDEPRIHFAINCASYSCPKLANKAFTPANLENLLDQATTEFINDPKRNLLSSERASLSEIFNWYKKDFTENGSLVEFINKHAATKLTSNTKISFLNYNWALNEIE